MFNADLSWRDNNAERVGERRRRIENEMKTSPAVSESNETPIHTTEQQTPQIKPTNAFAAVRTKISSTLRLLHLKKQSDRPRQMESLCRLERTPTLLQREYRETPPMIHLPSIRVRELSNEAIIASDVLQQHRTAVLADHDDLFLDNHLSLQDDQTVADGKALVLGSWLSTASESDMEVSTTSCIDPAQGPTDTAVISQPLLNELPAPLVTTRLMTSDSGYMTHDSPESSKPESEQQWIWHKDQKSQRTQVVGPDAHTISTRRKIGRLAHHIRTVSTTAICNRLGEQAERRRDSVLQFEMDLEVLLWVNAAFERPIWSLFAKNGSAYNFSRDAFAADFIERVMLNVGGSAAEMYFTADEWPDCKSLHLTPTESWPCDEHEVVIPTNVTKHQSKGLDAMRAISNVLCGRFGPDHKALPFQSSSIDHIHVSRLASLLPIPQLLPFLLDCHRVLKPTGKLELRVVDAIPARGTIGPLLSIWLKDHLLINLDRVLRCHHPCRLLPKWLSQAGFSYLQRNHVDLVRSVSLPATTAWSKNCAVSATACRVLRELWKDSWGQYVVQQSGLQHWWWQDEEILKECLEWKTVWQIDWCCLAKVNGTRLEGQPF